MIHNPPIHPHSGRWPRPGPAGDDSIGATNPRRHTTRNPPCTRSPPPRGTRRHARRVPRQPGQEPAQGAAGDPTGCSSGTIKVANDLPIGPAEQLRRVRCSTATPLPKPRHGSSCPTGAPNNPQQHRTPRRAGRLLNPLRMPFDRGCHRHRHRHRRCRCTYPSEWLGTATWAGTGRRGFGSRGPAAPGATAAAGGVGYFSCSRAAVRKMAPRRWVNSAWVLTRVVNQSRWLPPARLFSASTTDSSAAW